MKKTLFCLAASTAFALAASGFAADETVSGDAKVKYKDNGGYVSTQSTEHTTPDGTYQESKGKTDVDVDSNGKVTKKMKTETITDPKGLMNKKKDVTESVTKDKAGGGYTQEVTSTHKDAAGDNVNLKEKADVNVDKSGNVTETSETKKTVNPKGIFNKSTTTTKKVKAVNGSIVEEKTETQ